MGPMCLHSADQVAILSFSGSSCRHAGGRRRLRTMRSKFGIQALSVWWAFFPTSTLKIIHMVIFYDNLTQLKTDLILYDNFGTLQNI